MRDRQLFAYLPEVHHESIHQLARKAKDEAELLDTPQPEGHQIIHSIAIDDMATRDIDDSMSVQLLTDSDVTIQTSITDVSAIVPASGNIVRYALALCETLYPLKGEIPMLTRRVGHDVASLHADKPRPVLTSVIHHRAGGIPTLIDVRREFTIPHRLTKQRIHQLQKNEGIDSDQLTEYRRLSQASFLLAQRREKSAGLVLNGEGVSVYRGENEEFFTFDNRFIPPDIPVREFAIVTNEAMAFHFQDIDMPRLNRVMGPDDERAHYSSAPLEHRILGLELYTHYTSPLRRIVDLMLHMNYDAFLKGKPYPFSQDFLDSFAAQLNAVREKRKALGMEASAFLLKQYGFSWVSKYASPETKHHQAHTHNPKKLAHHLFPKTNSSKDTYLRNQAVHTLEQNPELIHETLARCHGMGAIAFTREHRKINGRHHIRSLIHLGGNEAIIVSTVDRKEVDAHDRNMQACLASLLSKPCKELLKEHDHVEVTKLSDDEIQDEAELYKLLVELSDSHEVRFRGHTELIVTKGNMKIYRTTYTAHYEGKQMKFEGYGSSKSSARQSWMSRAVSWLSTLQQAQGHSSLSSSIS